jgi:4-amino-4-deoxy-L-arabinose transferase-like glycosyltransferase
MVIGRAATADAVLNVFITLCLLDAYRYFEQPRALVRHRAYLWMGLGVLTKGPIAILIPLVVSFLYAAIQKRWRDWRRAIINPLGWLILLAVTLPWYLLEYHAQGQAFIDGFFLKHNIGRFSKTMEGHGGNLFYYFPVALLICLPFTGLLLRILPRVRQALKDPLDLWLWLWFGFIFLFFSFSNTQLPHYLLYGATPLFLLMAKYRDDLRSKALAYAPLLLWLIVLLLLPEILQQSLGHAGDPYSQALAQHAAEVFGISYRVGLLVALLVTVGIMLLRNKPLWYGLLAAGAVHGFVIVQWLAPVAGELLQQPVKTAALLSRSYPQEVVMWNINMPSFTVYRQKITPRRRPHSGELVFTRIDALPKLGPHEVIYSKGGIVLAKKL